MYTFHLLIGIFFMVSLFSLFTSLFTSLYNSNFRKTTICYDYLITFIQYVSPDNYYMNYGLWNTANTMELANINLCSFIFNIAKLSKNHTILDIGCGYGSQDFLLDSLVTTSTITAVDLSTKQVDFANEKAKKISTINNITFTQADAHTLTSKFQTKFDRIFSIESAFHYNDRPLFFNQVQQLLSNDGIFVISDIMLHDNYVETYSSNFFLKLASDFMCIPTHNFIKYSVWKKQVEENLEIVQIYDISADVFNPYYSYFLKIYIKQKRLPEWVANILIWYAHTVQPFSYIVASCKNKLNCIS